MSPRTLMVVSNLVRGVTVSVLAVLVLTDHAALWQLYLLAAIFGVADAFFMPAINTVLPMLISEEGLPAANGLMQVAQQLTGLIGPAVAGVAVALVGTGAAFSIDAGSFAVSTVTALALVGGRRTSASETPAGDGGAAARRAILTSIREGLAYAWRDPAIRSLVLITAAINFAFGGPVNVGLPWLAKNAYGGAAALGFVIAAFGGGALLGAVVAGSLPTVRRLGTVITVLIGVMGVAFGFMGALPSAIPAAGLLSVVGVGAGFANVQVIAWLQARTPWELRGRVMSLVMLGSHGLYPISLAIAGVVVDLGAAPLLFAAGGAVIVVAMLVGLSSGVAGRMNAPAPSTPAGAGPMESEAAS
jgi:MFS family permease